MLDNITKVKPPKSAGGTRSQVFRTQLYSYGKLAGTAKVLPGIANTSVGRFLGDSRKKAYPLARGLGNIEALMGGNMIAQVIARAGRIGSGAVSGRLIDMAVRPLGLPPFLARQARVQLGKRLSKETKFDRHLKNATQTIFGKVKINGPAANEVIQRSVEVHKDAQKLLNMIERHLRMYAPDVSSGQFLIGYKEGAKKYQQEMINDSAMMSQARFEKMGIKNFSGGNKFKFRDIFGFEEPGVARRYLLSSIDKDNVFRAKRGDNFFFYGQIDVGGSPLFPWIHAVEYGGKLPYYQRTGYKRGGYQDHFNDGKQMVIDINNYERFMEYNKGAKPNQYSILKYQYIPPSMFIYRSAADALAKFRKLADFQYLGDIDKSSTRYFHQWNEIAKRKYGVSSFYQNETSYTKPSNTKNTLDDLYKLDRKTRNASFRSRLEAKIPGPRVEMAQGNFYSQELASTIGLEHVPEEFRFQFKVPMTSNFGSSGPNVPFTQEFVATLAQVYVKTGGTRDRVIRAMQKEILHNKSSGNILRNANLKMPKAESQRARLQKNLGIRNMVFGDVRHKYYMDYRRAEKEATRLYDVFAAQATSLKSMNRGGERTREYLKKMYQFSTKKTGDKVTVYTKLRQNRESKGTKQANADRSMLDSLAKEFLSDMELDEIYRSTNRLSF